MVEIIGSSGLPWLDWMAEFTFCIILLILLFDFITALVSQKGGVK